MSSRLRSRRSPYHLSRQGSRSCVVFLADKNKWIVKWKGELLVSTEYDSLKAATSALDDMHARLFSVR